MPKILGPTSTPPTAATQKTEVPTDKPDVRLAVTVAYGAMSPERFEDHLGAPAPNVRLALQSNQGGESDGNAKGFCAPAADTSPPTVRLVAANDAGRVGAGVIASGLTDQSPSVRLAHGPGAQGDNVLIGQRGVDAMPDDRLPGLLVSYYYLPQFLENRHRYHYRDWVMDSGAFSAHNSGVEIKLQDYIDCCKKLMAEDPTLVEIYALDVIGDWRASLHNTEEMWRQGVPAIPCFHVNEPWDALVGMAKDYPKIALGGVAQIGSKKAVEWASQCFARIWPKKVHGFAMCNEKSVMTLPLHSVDSTSWELGPCRYGQWRAFGGQRVSVRGSKQNLRVEVEWYLELERKARAKWKRQMAELEQATPTIRLALAGASVRKADGTSTPATYYKPGGLLDQALSGPTIRLAESGEGGRQEAKMDAFKKE